MSVLKVPPGNGIMLETVAGDLFCNAGTVSVFTGT